jgi:hypothetical protein
LAGKSWSGVIFLDLELSGALPNTPLLHVDLTDSLFVWLVADGWCWFVLRVKYCWLIAGGWFVLREKYCWLVADKPSEQGARVNGFCPKPKKNSPNIYPRSISALPKIASLLVLFLP